MLHDCYARLGKLGINLDDAVELRRVSMALHAWHERECGLDNGCIERGVDGKPYWLDARTGRTFPIRDMEAGALRRLSHVMARYPALSAYVQGDPRGPALYILRPGDVPAGRCAEAYYTSGLAVHK